MFVDSLQVSVGNKVGLRIDPERNLFVEALVYEIKGKRVSKHCQCDINMTVSII